MPETLTIKRSKIGQFVKGDPALSERSRLVGLAQKGRVVTWGDKISKAQIGKKLSQEHKDLLRKIALEKGQTNTGRTHFKPGQIPHNYKGGITKTKEYIAFYKSRYKFYKRNATGGHTFFEWQKLKADYKNTCPGCGKSEPEIKLTEDHIIPLSKGGTNNIENIQPLCQPCNSRKHAKLIPKYELCLQ